MSLIARQIWGGGGGEILKRNGNCSGGGTPYIKEGPTLLGLPRS